MSTLTIAGHDLRISNTDKNFYPGENVTKGDVIEYYRAVADTMVPHLRGRPLTLRRCPDGIDGECWIQKEASDYFPDWLRVANVPQRGDGTGSKHYALAEDAASLLYLANQATLEFHIWTSTVDNLNRPDLLVIDLDPPDDSKAALLRETARKARGLFQDIGLTPYLQTTGGRGYHIVAPLDANEDFETVRALAGEAAEALAHDDPERLTTAHRKHKRGDRVFLDTNRNGYAQTFITPYSLRSRQGATAATPIDWSELGRVDPAAYDVTNLPRRLARKADPWRDMHRHAGSARQARERLSKRG